MPVQMNKSDLNKMLVEERAKMRSKQKQSAFMRRTASIYNSMKKRMREHTGNKLVDLSFTLNEFRDEVDEALLAPCCYCDGKLTLKTVTADHMLSIVSGGSWDITNLCFPCQSCNWQKGRLSSKEFRLLMKFMHRYLSAESMTDVRRRLTIGGKWSPR